MRDPDQHPASSAEQHPAPGQSTGPRTPAGKERASRNSTTHGLTGTKFLLLPDESQADFDALCETWTAEYKDYASPGLERLLKNLIEADWLQERAYKKVFASEYALANAEQTHEPGELVQEIFRRLQLMYRYKTACENSYQRALRAIESFRKSRYVEQLAQSRTRHTRLNAAFIASNQVCRFIKRGFSKDDACDLIVRLDSIMNSAPGDPIPRKE